MALTRFILRFARARKSGKRFLLISYFHGDAFLLSQPIPAEEKFLAVDLFWPQPCPHNAGQGAGSGCRIAWAQGDPQGEGRGLLWYGNERGGKYM